MNRSTITGRLTRDPELRSLPTGDVVCTIRLAVDDMAGRGETGYINAASFGNSGEAAARILAKGWLVAIDGRLRYTSWTTNDGENRHDYQLVGNIEFLSPGRPSSGFTPPNMTDPQPYIVEVDDQCDHRLAFTPGCRIRLPLSPSSKLCPSSARCSVTTASRSPSPRLRGARRSPVAGESFACSAYRPTSQTTRTGCLVSNPTTAGLP